MVNSPLIRPAIYWVGSHDPKEKTHHGSTSWGGSHREAPKLGHLPRNIDLVVLQQKPWKFSMPWCTIHWYQLDLPPTQDASGKWRFRLGFPTKNVITLVVTVTGWGVDLRYQQKQHHKIPKSKDEKNLTFFSNQPHSVSPNFSQQKPKWQKNNTKQRTHRPWKHKLWGIQQPLVTPKPWCLDQDNARCVHHGSRHRECL